MKFRRRSVLLICFALQLGLGACKEAQDPGSIDQPPLGQAPHMPTPTATATPAPTVTPKPTPTPTSTPSNTSLYSGPPELAKYVQKFVDDAKIQGVDVETTLKAHPLTLRIASLASYGSSVIGLCEYTSTGRRVTLSPSFWNTVSETQKELLAHHELGHCVLGRAHRTALLSSGAYASIMYPIIMSSSTYNGNYDYYQNELFTWGANAASSAESTEPGVRHICNLQEH